VRRKPEVQMFTTEDFLCIFVRKQEVIYCIQKDTERRPCGNVYSIKQVFLTQMFSKELLPDEVA